MSRLEDPDAAWRPPVVAGFRGQGSYGALSRVGARPARHAERGERPGPTVMAKELNKGKRYGPTG